MSLIRMPIVRGHLCEWMIHPEGRLFHGTYFVVHLVVAVFSIFALIHHGYHVLVQRQYPRGNRHI